MIRRVFLLLAALGIALAVMGEDHGQRRAGLKAQPDAVALETPAQTGAPKIAALAPPAKSPAKPPAQPPAAQLPAAKPIPATEASVRTVAALPPPASAATPASTVAGAGLGAGVVRLIAAQGVNMRSGPSRSYGVIASLLAGDAVEVLSDDDPTSGWRHVVLADGRRGYLAKSLMTEAP